MTEATPNQFEDLGEVKANVRRNEKVVDEIKGELREIRSEIKALDAKLDTKVDGLTAKITELSKSFDSLGWKALLGIIVIVAANVILKVWP